MLHLRCHAKNKSTGALQGAGGTRLEGLPVP